MESPQQLQQPYHQPYRQRRTNSSPRPSSLKRSLSKMNELPPPRMDQRYLSDSESGTSQPSSSPSAFPHSTYELRPPYNLPGTYNFPSAYNPHLPSQPLSHFPEPMIHLPPIQGDSYPTGPQSSRREPERIGTHEVIDLTGSDDVEVPSSSSPVIQNVRPAQTSRPATRLPRFSAEVINLEDSPPHASARRANPNMPQQESHHDEDTNTDNNDVQLLFSRPRSHPYPSMQDDSGYFSFIREPGRRLLGEHPPNHRSSNQRIEEVLMRADRRQGNTSGSHEPTARNPSGMGYVSRVRSHVSRRISDFQAMVMPTALDYTATGFHLFGYSLGGLPDSSPPPAARPAHEELAPAKEGFTRSPQEDDILICPNCLQELCTSDEDLKRQVSVIKGCGHVYCGECAPKSRKKMATRGRSAAGSSSASSATGKGKKAAGQAGLGGNNNNVTKPITKCVIEGCGKSAGSRDVIHVFL